MRERMSSIRVRATAGAVLVAGVSLALAAITMVTILQRSLRENVRSAALLRARTFADELASGVSADIVIVDDPEADQELIQVLDAEGKVVLASSNLAGRDAIVHLAPGETRIIAPRSPEDVEPLDEPFMVAVSSTVTSRGRLTVIVARSLEVVADASDTLKAELAVAMPLLLLVIGVLTWRVVGRALSPVDAIRAQVEAISSRELHRRVSEPPGSDEISRLAATMNRMLARLQAGRLRERRFVSDASHELRSPVATIRQHAEVAMAHPEQTDTRELAEIVLDEDARLQRLVEDLLLLTKIDEGTLERGAEPVDLDDLVFEEAKRLRGATDLRIDVAGVSAGRVSGDGEQLGRLIRNLTDNAARHTHTTIALVSVRAGRRGRAPRGRRRCGGRR